ncbi:MAG: hypothetical protein HQM11_05270 [SAR324 cluster bacterium]|nr:hypothetical protein [SAR324 cluster bacterium]
MLFTGLILLFIMGAGTWIYLNSHRIPSWIHQYTGLQLETRSIELTSPDRFQFTLTANHINLFENSPEEPVLTLENFKLSIDASHLLKRKLIIQELLIAKLQAELYISAENDLRLGTFALKKSSSESSSSGFSWIEILFKKLNIHDSHLTIQYPESYQIPPLRITGIESQIDWENALKQAAFQTEVFLGNYHGQVQLKVEGTGESWDGTCNIIDVPLDFLQIPAVDGVFSAIPVSGILNVTGKIHSQNLAEWNAQINWDVKDLRLTNPAFPDEVLNLSTISGQGSVNSNHDSLVARMDIPSVQLPFGHIRFNGSWIKTNEIAGRLNVQGITDSWKIEEVKPWLTVFLPQGAGQWIQTSLHRGMLDQLQLSIAYDQQNETSPLDLKLTGQFSEVKMSPFENIPDIEQGKGTLQLDLKKLLLSFDSGVLPGIRISGGSLQLEYGMPDRVPLHIDAVASADSNQAWQAFRPLWSPGLPLLNHVELAGGVEGKFNLDIPDLSHDLTVAMTIALSPQGIEASLKEAGNIYQIKHLTGLMSVTLEALKFENIRFEHEQQQGELNGQFALAAAQDTTLTLALSNLGPYLPVYAEPDHFMAQWLPKNMDATLKIKKSSEKSQPTPWLFEIETVDDQKQSLEIESKLEQEQFSITNMTGKLGQIFMSGNLDFSKSNSSLKTRIGRENPFLNMDWQWNNHAGIIKLEINRLDIEEWKKWELSPALKQLLPRENNTDETKVESVPSRRPDLMINQWTVDAKLKELILPDGTIIPVEVSGNLKIDEQYHLNLSKLASGDEHGHLNYNGTLNEGKLVLFWNKLDVPYWMKTFAHSSSPQHTTTAPQIPLQQKTGDSNTEQPEQNDNNLQFFRNYEMSLEIPELILPGNAPAPLKGNIAFHQGNNTLKIDFPEIQYGPQSATGSVTYQNKKVEVFLEDAKIEALPWVNLARTMPRSESTSDNTILEEEAPLDYIRLKAIVSSFRISPDFEFPVHFEVQIVPGLGLTRVFVDECRTPYFLAKSSITLWPNAQDLILNFKTLEVAELMKVIQREDWPQWMNSTLVGQPIETPPSSGQVTFNFKSEESFIDALDPVPLSLKGKFQWDAVGNWNGDLYEIAWARQAGNLTMSNNNRQFKIGGDFEYLDFALWRQLADAWSEGTPHEEKKETPQPSVENTNKETPPWYELTIPAINAEFNIKAQRMKFLESVFSNFQIKGQFTPDKLKISRLFWEKRADPAFSLMGYLKRNPQDNYWRGNIVTEVYDLGDLLTLLQTDSSEEPLEIRQGNTQVQADIVLSPLADRRWTFNADLRGESFEGIIPRGNSIVFIVAALSIQSYVKAAEGKLSGLEGKGLVYNHLSADMQIRGGQLQIRDFTINSPTIKIVSLGKMDLAQDSQLLLVCLQPFESVDKVFSNIPLASWILTNKRGAFIEFCYEVSGNTEDPTIIALPQSVLPGRISDFFMYDVNKGKGQTDTPIFKLIKP